MIRKNGKGNQSIRDIKNLEKACSGSRPSPS